MGNEKDIRLAVLKDELERWQNDENRPTYPYGYVGDMLKGRIRELENGRLSGK